ncbi:hypothetical protein YC2023_088891 [Brassica napus]
MESCKLFMATLHDRCVSKELKNQRLLPKMIYQSRQMILTCLPLESIQKMMESVPWIGFLIEGYHAEKPLKIQISATLKQQLIVWENITHQDKVQPGSAADGSSQANDIDGKKKIKWARSCY